MNEHRKTSLPDIIAGPCSAENQQQVIQTALALKTIGIRTMRAGVWKPRSRYGRFEGAGEAALPWLQEVQQVCKLKVMTEVALPIHVEAALRAGMDMLWIGARTTANPFMMNELAAALKGTQIPVFLKNPICPDLNLWIGSIERLQLAGVNQLRLIHRGFCILDNEPYRNSPLWDLPWKMKNLFPDLPMYCDPSHIAGKKELVYELCTEALKRNYEGLFIECHTCPSKALSDAQQQITPAELKDMILQF